MVVTGLVSAGPRKLGLEQLEREGTRDLQFYTDGTKQKSRVKLWRRTRKSWNWKRLRICGKLVIALCLHFSSLRWWHVVGLTDLGGNHTFYIVKSRRKSVSVQLSVGRSAAVIFQRERTRVGARQSPLPTDTPTLRQPLAPPTAALTLLSLFSKVNE